MTIQNINDGDLASVAFGNINDLIDAFNSLDTSAIGLFSLSPDGTLLWDGGIAGGALVYYAYDKALTAGFVGTPEEWLDTLNDVFTITTADTNKVLSNDGKDARWVVVDKTLVGLDNVDNTSDANKPISTAMGLALGEKLNILDFQAQLDLSTIDRGYY